MGSTVAGWVTALMLSASVPSVEARLKRGEKALRGGDLDAAQAAFEEVLKADPRSASALVGLGDVDFRRGKKVEAVQRFEAATHALPELPRAYSSLGYAAQKLGDFTRAAQAFERYTSLDPLDPDGYFALGEAYRALHQNPQAVRAYRQYLHRQGRADEEKWVTKAKRYVQELGGAGAAAGPAALSGGDAPPTASALAARVADGDRAALQNRPADAAAAYQDVLRAQASHLEARFKLGSALARLGELEGAAREWRQVLRGTGPGSFQRLVEENLKRLQRPAADGGVKALATFPTTPRELSRPLYEEGIREVSARDYARAVASLTGALQEEPELAAAYVARGSAYLGLRQYSQALEDYERGLALDPSKAAPLYGAAEAARALGKASIARGYYVRYSKSAAPDVNAKLRADAQRKAGAP